MLIQESVHSLVVSSIGAIVGSVGLILAIDHFNRKRFQYITFVGKCARTEISDH